MRKVVLCVDSESLRRPELVGLEGENLSSQSWLKTFSSAKDAREYFREGGDASEVWIASSDDMDAVNAAAAIKRDNASIPVHVLAFSATGSFLSRANAASIDSVLSRGDFVRRYGETKKFTLESSSKAAMRPPEVFPSEIEVALDIEEPRLPILSKNAPKGSSNTFLLPVVSGSGGVGKSAVAVLAALMAQSKGYSTLLLDLDLRFGDMREFLNSPNALSVEDVVKNPEYLANARPCEGKPALIAAPSRLEAAEELTLKTSWLLDRLMGNYDVIVVNTGTSWDESHAVLLERATKVLFLVDQRVSSIRSCKHALELCSRCGIAYSSFVFAVNRCSKTAMFTSIDVSCALQGAHVVELSDGGSEVEELMGAGTPNELLNSHNAFSTTLLTLISALLPPIPSASDAPASEEPVRKGLFGWIKSRKKGGGHVSA